MILFFCMFLLYAGGVATGWYMAGLEDPFGALEPREPEFPEIPDISRTLEEVLEKSRPFSEKF